MRGGFFKNLAGALCCGVPPSTPYYKVPAGGGSVLGPENPTRFPLKMDISGVGAGVCASPLPAPNPQTRGMTIPHPNAHPPGRLQPLKSGLTGGVFNSASFHVWRPGPWPYPAYVCVGARRPWSGASSAHRLWSAPASENSLNDMDAAPSQCRRTDDAAGWGSGAASASGAGREPPPSHHVPPWHLRQTFLRRQKKNSPGNLHPGGKKWKVGCNPMKYAWKRRKY